MPAQAPSPWKVPLVRELAIILLIKLALLLVIKAVWFDQPTVPADGSRVTSQHLLGDSRPSDAEKESAR
ncbi:cytochrome oxidase putative small subunit CydP [Enterobacterales bacterium AE_CKDN230030158-1A_HGKHYDSX7]